MRRDSSLNSNINERQMTLEKEVDFNRGLDGWDSMVVRLQKKPKDRETKGGREAVSSELSHRV